MTACKHTNATPIGYESGGIALFVKWCRCCGAVKYKWNGKRDTWRKARHPPKPKS